MLPVPSVHGQQGWGLVGLGVTGLSSLSAAGLGIAQAFPSLAPGPDHSLEESLVPLASVGQGLAPSVFPSLQDSIPS